VQDRAAVLIPQDADCGQVPKLRVTSPNQENICFYGTGRFITVFTQVSHWALALVSQLNPVHMLMFYLCKIQDTFIKFSLLHNPVVNNSLMYHHRVQNGSGAHPRGSFFDGKAAGA